jgi:hypothetical protein
MYSCKQCMRWQRRCKLSHNVCPCFLSKFSNLTRSCSADMVQLAPGIAWHYKQHATDDIMFVFVCFSKFGNLARSCSLAQLKWFNLDNALHDMEIKMQLMTSCLSLLIYLDLVTPPDLAQWMWFNLQLGGRGHYWQERVLLFKFARKLIISKGIANWNGISGCTFQLSESACQLNWNIKIMRKEVKTDHLFLFLFLFNLKGIYIHWPFICLRNCMGIPLDLVNTGCIETAFDYEYHIFIWNLNIRTCSCQ